MSAEQPTPMITEVPGAEPFTGQLPDSRRVPIPADQVTPQMHRNAIGSPNNPNSIYAAPMPEAAANSAEQVSSNPAEALGSTVTGSLVEVDTEIH